MTDDLESISATRPRKWKGLWVWGVLLVAVAGGLGLYWFNAPVSEPTRAAATPSSSAAPQAADQATPDKPLRALSEDQLQRMIDQSAAQVRNNPNDAAAWAMLAHSYDMLGKFAESSAAYAKLVPLLPGDAQVLADYADALAVTQGRKLIGEPTALINRALAIDGKNLKALALAGSAAFERQTFDEAIDFWQRAREVAKDPAFRQEIENSIARAKAASKGETLGDQQVPGSRTEAASAVAAGPRASVSGRVSLADGLVTKAKPDATVFIFARPATGSRMPVALLRKRVRDLPADFTLDDSNSMVPANKLSQVPMLVIGARVSQRGDVTPQPGDMQGLSAPVSPGTQGIRLEISEVLK
jgi:cytochrome c-type biogenesis protein CcmH